MIQRLIDIFYRHPKEHRKQINRFGGSVSYKKMLASEKDMILAIRTLKPISSEPGGFPIYFLTGKKYIHQTIFCILSLSKVTKLPLNFVLVDDGSFDSELTQFVNENLPKSTIVSKSIIDANLNRVLPKNLFPYLHHKREVYPHIKKLTDIHTISDHKHKLVLDSDMLFWSEPTAIIEWLKHPSGVLSMQDKIECYGYSKELMSSLCGTRVPDLVNVGVIGLTSSTINWSKIEEWCKVLESKEGETYFLEQALTAMIIAEAKHHVLNPQDYIVLPNDELIHSGKGTLHHYVDLSKKEYFLSAWKKML